MAAGRQKGFRNYNKAVLKRVVAEVKPDGPKKWMQAAVLYQQETKEPSMREPKHLKNFWTKTMCNNMRKPSGATGGLGDEVFESQQIQEMIMKQRRSEFIGLDFEDGDGDAVSDLSSCVEDAEATQPVSTTAAAVTPVQATTQKTPGTVSATGIVSSKVLSTSDKTNKSGSKQRGIIARTISALEMSNSTMEALLSALAQQKQDKLEAALREREREKDIILLKENLTKISHNLVGDGADCTGLKQALLGAKEEGGFLCLPDPYKFPVSIGETTNKIPSKILMRSFHSEVKLILQKLRDDRKKGNLNGGAIFFGPSGTGKSWTAQAVLVDELRDAQQSGRTVVYFDSRGSRAFVFSKERSVFIKFIGTPNEIAIPELMESDTVLIFDAARGIHAGLVNFQFPCHTLIFSSPNAGDFKQIAENNGLMRFICPSWTVEELKLLGRGYGGTGRYSADEVESRFALYGGSPRAVVANNSNVAEILEANALRVLKGVELWSDVSAMSPDWPSRLLKAQYATEELAKTPEEAFNKYSELNVTWTYSTSRAMELVHAKYDQADEAQRRTFQSWLEGESKARALYGYLLEYKARSLFSSAPDEDIEVKALEANEGLSKDMQDNLNSIMAEIHRDLMWTLPKVQRVQDALLTKTTTYDMTDLSTLTDPAVMYRLPRNFPLIDYFNPPNNCFSLGVGAHNINLKHALDLCSAIVPATRQINFVYVTPSRNYANVNRWQSFVPSNDTQKTLGKLPSDNIRVLSRMVQFCMRFKKF